MSLSNPSQLVLRSESLFAGRQVLLAGAPCDGLAQELSTEALCAWNWDTGHHQAFQRQGVRAHFGVVPPAGPFDVAIVFMPKAKPRLKAVLAALPAVLAEGGVVYLVGEKREGTDSAGKWLEAISAQPKKIDRARHCILWAARVQPGLPAAGLQATCQSLAVGDVAWQQCSLPGVFSEGRLDEGTRLLLEHLPVLAGPRVLDFGCGSGVISAFVLQRQPVLQLTAVDADAFALACTEATLAANGRQAMVMAADGFQALAGQQFDAIVSNPPFHDGIRTDTRMAEGFLRDMARHLVLGGELWLVANRFLPYATVLAASFSEVAIVAETARFVVYHARRG